MAPPQSRSEGRLVQGNLELGMQRTVPERFATFGRSSDRLPFCKRLNVDILNWSMLLGWVMLKAEEKGEKRAASRKRRIVLYDIAQVMQ